MAATIFGFDAATVNSFDKAYAASKDPRIQALWVGSCGIPGQSLDPFARYKQAYQLAQEGLIIDARLDAEGADPYITMFIRLQYGYVWVPSALQPNITSPSDLQGPMPPGAIKVSINLEDYPPFNPPAPPPPPETNLVGGFLFGDMWSLTMEATKLAQVNQLPLVNGEYQEGGHTYTLFTGVFLGQLSYYWTRVS